jgi:hypothetical protein
LLHVGFLAVLAEAGAAVSAVAAIYAKRRAMRTKNCCGEKLAIYAKEELCRQKKFTVAKN